MDATSSSSLKLYVVVHTDNAGFLDSNMKLSKDRANAVTKGPVEPIRNCFRAFKALWRGLPGTGCIQ